MASFFRFRYRMALLTHQRNRLIVFAAALVLVAVVFLMMQGALPGLRKSGPINPQGPPAITVEVWNVFEDADLYGEIFADFRTLNPHVTINYKKIDYLEYRKKLTEAFANGTAPDIFALHNAGLPQDILRIAPAPSTLALVREFDEVYPRVVAFDFTRKDQNGARLVYAAPLSIETLGFFYNKDYFESANVSSPPKVWEEILDYAKLFTQFDDAGAIKISGVALGAADNINRSADIVTLLMLQSGTRMNNELLSEATFDEQVWVGEGEQARRFQPGKEALEFYLSFSDPTKTVYSWNEKMPYSIDAFVEGKTAMMLNYPHHIGTIRSKAPHLNFGVAPMLQLRDRKEDINYASYWGFTVAKTSKNVNTAWELIDFLSKPEQTKKYLEKAKMPTARRDLILWQQQDQDLKYFANQIMSARSWYSGDSLAADTILTDMIRGASSGEKKPDEALLDAAARVTVILQKTQE